MRGDHLARQWRIIRVTEASPDGLTVAKIATARCGTWGRTEEKPFKSLFQ